MLTGADETKLTREALKWPYGEFEIPNEVYDAFSAAGKKGKAVEEEWNKVQRLVCCNLCVCCIGMSVIPRGKLTTFSVWYLVCCTTRALAYPNLQSEYHSLMLANNGNSGCYWTWNG